jgi:hypothetical protein
VDSFEAALHSQSAAKIEEAGRDLESFMTPFFRDE